MLFAFSPLRRSLLWMGLLAFGMPLSVKADPTAEQQYMLELVNRLRMDPTAELDKLVNMSSPGVWDSPKSDHVTVAAALEYYGVSASALASQWGSLTVAPPLAWNDSLAAASTTYSNLMITQDQQDHFLDGLSVGQRIVNAGYSANWGDSAQALFATAADGMHAHSALAIDWGPDGGSGTGIQPGATHRAALMDPLYKEIGIGFQTIIIPITNGEVTGPVVLTEHLANVRRDNGVTIVSDAILTGSIFDDSVLGDNFYTPGEGVSGVLIFVYDNTNGNLVASGQTNSAGGYNITLTGLTDGTEYRVEAPGTGQGAQTFTLNTWQENYGTVVDPEWTTFYDNVYASFVAVPEPGSAGLLLLSLMLLSRRRRH
ncbi:MAG: CAP domain-containing protein [Verrucomicrobiota bacterium]